MIFAETEKALSEFAPQTKVPVACSKPSWHAVSCDTRGFNEIIAQRVSAGRSDRMIALQLYSLLVSGLDTIIEYAERRGFLASCALS